MTQTDPLAKETGRNSLKSRLPPTCVCGDGGLCSLPETVARGLVQKRLFSQWWEEGGRKSRGKELLGSH